uniref:DNA-binding transcriptional regulator, LysR family n=1 Tax=uncultured Thiotrichaceae bacterium TaxID=298394 RepID=A0A6S6UIB7_9GAMM|nr:MAG: DNA-binding transcriptional regulator, LysR family [uncultured Thiotrichaceae bacterium]
MTPKQIRSVLKVVEVGSVNRAAEVLHLAPSSISAQIRELSQELGVALFDQVGRRIVLSRAGQGLLPDFKRFHALTQDIEQQARSVSHEAVGELKLFAPSSMCIYRLPPLIEALQKTAPQLEVTLTHEPFDYQAALHNREIDAAILVSQYEDEQWENHPLMDESVIYVCHPDRHQNKKLSLEELQREPLITTEPGCSYRVVAEGHFKTQGLTLKPRQSFSNVEVIRRCLLANMGVALLPRCVVAEDLQRGDLVGQAVEGAPYGFRSMLVYPKGMKVLPKLGALIECIYGDNKNIL